MEAMLHDPAIVDQMLTMMTDPEAMKEAQRMTDNALNELSDIPGGEAMYERVMSQYYEPLEKELLREWGQLSSFREPPASFSSSQPCGQYCRPQFLRIRIMLNTYRKTQELLRLSAPFP
jgi:hypothetical protein